MGYIRHDVVCAIVYETDMDNRPIEKAMNELKAEIEKSELAPCLLGPVRGTNGYESYFFAADGSKEGWDTSDLGDEFRERFKAIVKSAKYPNLVHLQMAGDDGQTLILETTDENEEENEL